MIRQEVIKVKKNVTADDESAPGSDWCAHCGSPAVGSVQPVFCCNGCRGAFELIHGWGLEAFYDLRSEPPANVTDDPNSSRFQVFDQDTFLGRSAPVLQDDGLWKTKLTVLNLHCAACAWLIENVAAQTAGWHASQVRLNDHTIEITFDRDSIAISQIARLLSHIGYELLPLVGDGDIGFIRENRNLLTRIAIAGFCAVNAMWIAIALYAGDATGLAESHRSFLRLIGTGLGVASVVFPGRTFFVGAIAALRTRTPHMDLPIALGLSVGTGSGLVSLAVGQGEIYFDSLAILVFLLLIGRWIQFRGQHRAAKAVDLMLRITPQHARRLSDSGDVTLVPVQHLEKDDLILVAAGESFPADGEIVRGRSLVDQSLLTGESRPTSATIGDAVEAGAVNTQREIDVKVQATGADSRIGKVMQAVEQASAQGTPVNQLADRIGGAFVVVVSVLSLLTFAYWMNFSWGQAATNATALLIVACPCALALATPLAIAVAIGKSAKYRILVRDGATLTQLAKPGTIFLDKTGTLTEGRPTATLRWGSERGLRIAAAIEQKCIHPIANAICLEAVRLQLQHVNDVNDVEGVEALTGGVCGRAGGHDVMVGNPYFMKEHGVELDRSSQTLINKILGEDSTPILIAIDQTLETVVAINDRLKKNAAKTISRLRKAGWKIGILSGDHSSIVDRVGEQLGLAEDQCHGGLSPEQKLHRVASSAGTSDQTTVMVGDGANDAAALAAADVGIAVRGGAEVSLRAAPVFMASGDLANLVWFIHASKQTMRLIHTAILASLAYNVFAVGLAMTGSISPLVAAILMPISSITVLSLCLSWPIYSRRTTP